MDRDLATILGKTCVFVYDFDAGLLAELGAPAVKQFQDHKPIPTSFAAVLDFPDQRVLTFQGTITEFKSHDPGDKVTSVVDWVKNFEVDMDRDPKLSGRVHRGFLNQLNRIFDEVVRFLKSSADGRPLLVTGHSQGGAVAVLATMALASQGVAVSATYTFAAPRPGDAAFAAGITTPVHRLEFGNDIVPHVPFKRPSLGLLQPVFDALIAQASGLARELLKKTGEGYVSVGPLSYGGPHAALLEDMSEAEERALARERVLALFTAGKELVEHHHMSNYLAMLGG
jgi:triacylglycerol lipase